MQLARKIIDTEALVSNYRYLKSCCPGTRVLAVVKSEAYGHGLVITARALSGKVSADGFAVAVVDEAMTLRECGVTRMVLVMQGGMNKEELHAAASRNLTLVVHSPEQLALLEKHGAEKLSLWVKFDTGMNRLGFPPESAAKVLERVKRLRGLARPPVLMSHFAYADEPGMAADDERQWLLFEKLCAEQGLSSSIANSAATLCRPESRLDWVRVGIALYGVPPENAVPEHHRQLKPVMKVTAPLTAIRQCKAGDRIGYGGTYTCHRRMRIGVVGIGYGEGYPRNAPGGTPVWLGNRCHELVGRVSMDMLTVGLDEDDTPHVGDVVELWGPNLAVSEVARHCRTSSYELLCAARSIEEA